MLKKWMRGDLLILVICLILTLLIGYIGSVFTASSVNTWYQTLIKPEFTPSSVVFSVVWTILYVLMGISLFLIVRQNNDIYNVRQAIKWFSVQLILNLLWSFVFFYLQSPFFGLIIIIMLWFSIIGTIKAAGKVSTWSAILLYPYLLWVTFAIVLNGAIWWLNQ